MNDPMGDRIKSYEDDTRFDPHLPVVARLDGKAFHSWTRGFERPFDNDLRNCFENAMRALVEESGARFGYTQSDEVTLVFKAGEKVGSEIFMGGRKDKMTSVLASMMTAFFAEEVRAWFGPDVLEARGIPFFDCRVFQVPSDVEAMNVVLWRYFDACRNGVRAVAQSVFSHKELHGKSVDDMENMLAECNIYLTSYPTRHLYGSMATRERVTKGFSAEEIERLPEFHPARTNPEFTVERSVVSVNPMYQFERVCNRVEVIFKGATPIFDEE